VLKTVDAIYEEMLACFGERTGMELKEGCDLAVRLYALAAQIYALQVQTDWVSRQAFPQTAEGEWLDRHAQLRGLARKQAVAARGVVRFQAGEAAQTARVIPVGTVCMTAGLVRFETTEERELPAGARTVDVPVRAVVPGRGGNVAAGTILSLAVAPLGIAGCTNLQPCAGGEDEEKDETLRARVLDTFLRLPNGANAAFYQTQALTFDRVAGAVVIPRPRGVGTVDVVVTTQEGLPDRELLEELTAYFQRRREIAVEVQVRAPQTTTVNLTVRVAPKPGYAFAEVAGRVEEAVRGWFTGALLGRKVLRAELGDLVYHCDGVDNYVIALPTADVAVEADVLPMLGTLKVEELT